MSLTYSAGGAMPLPKLAWAFDGTTTDYVNGVSGSVGGVINYEIGKYGNSLNIKNPSGTTSNSVNFNFSASYSIDLGFSECFWFKCNDLSYLTSIQIVSITYSGFNNAFKFQINTGGSLQFQFQDSVGNKNINMFGPTVGIWYHLAAVGFNGIVAIYVNGAYYAQTAYVQSGIAFNNISLGLATHFAGYPLTNGSYDDLRIYDQALTSAQVQSIYNQQGVPGRGALVPQSPQPNLMWQFESSNVDSVTQLAPTTTVGTPTYVAGKYGQAINFPNSTGTGVSMATNYSIYTVSLNSSSGYTFAFWVNFNVRDIFAQVILSLANSSGVRIVNIYLNASNQIVSYDNGSNLTVTSPTLNTGKWYHVALSVTNSSRVLYLNGVGTSGTSAVTGTQTSFILGGDLPSQGNFSAWCSYDDLRIYNTALTAAQVQAIYGTSGMPSRQVLSGTPLFSQLSSGATSSAVGAFSLRAVNGLSPSGTAKAVNVRNGTTAATQDFYADRLGNLLTAPVTGQSLANWLGGATGYVTTWYDQSGRGNHASQATVANQPVIQKATKGPGYACLFNGANSQVLSCAAGTYSLLNGTKYAVCVTERRNNAGTAGTQGGYFGLGNTGGPSTGLITGYWSSQTNMEYSHRGDNLDNTVAAYAGAAEPIRCTVFDYSASTTKRVYINSSILPVTNTSSDLVATTGAVTIGKSFGTANAGYYSGEMFELLIFTQSLYDLDNTGGLITKIYQNQLSYTGT